MPKKPGASANLRIDGGIATSAQERGPSRLDEVLDILGVPDSVRYDAKTNYNVRCPVHNDSRASLSVGRKRDNPAEIGFNCFVCGPAAIYEWFDKPTRWFKEAGDWTPRRPRRKNGANEIEAYPYYDLNGIELYRQTRYETTGLNPHKFFSGEHFVDGKKYDGVPGEIPRVLYNYPSLRTAIEADNPVDEVFWVEGEKDVDTLRSWLKVATTAYSGQVTPSLMDGLVGAKLVTIVADRDQPGYKKAGQVAELLKERGIPYRVVQSAINTPGSDITDHLRANHHFNDLVEIPNIEQLSIEDEVQDKIRQLRIVEEARRRILASSRRPIPLVKSLTQLLDEQDEAEVYRVDRIWPSEGHVVLSAQYKAGKTTLRDNWIKAQVDEHQFLNSFEVAPLKGRIGVLDFEMGDRTNRRHLRQMGVMHPDAVDFLDMRGVASSLNVLDPGSRREWLALIVAQDWSTVILDPIAPVLVALGLDESSNKDVRTFLNAWEELLAEADIHESLVIHHAGHGGDRARGAAAFRDWPAAYWDLNRERDKDGNTDDTKPSYFKAKGRDVDYPESELSFERTTLSLTIGQEGAGRKSKRSAETVEARNARVEALFEECKSWLATRPESVSLRAWRTVPSGTNQDKDDAYRRAEAAGLVARHTPKPVRARRTPSDRARRN